MPVMPRWNCSANSTIRRMVAISVETYSTYATRSPALMAPYTRDNPPARMTTKYIRPSKRRVDVLNAAMAW